MKSFLSGRPSATMGALKPLIDAPRTMRAPGGATIAPKPLADHMHLPAVECVKQGDKVTLLVVTCSCGERIEIDCLYAGPG